MALAQLLAQYRHAKLRGDQRVIAGLKQKIRRYTVVPDKTSADNSHGQKEVGEFFKWVESDDEAALFKDFLKKYLIDVSNKYHYLGVKEILAIGLEGTKPQQELLLNVWQEIPAQAQAGAQHNV
jgi:hypothetical protein